MHFLLPVAAIALFGVVIPCRAAQTCADLSDLKLPDTTIASAQVVAAGDFEVPVPVPGVPPLKIQLPAHCKVTGSIKPTADSDIRFEVWLPASSWNNRYQQGGNGGLAGSMFYFNMIDALLRGSATAGTDDGHQSESLFDASWIPGHPEKVVDYGHRAAHLTAVNAQAIVQAYYGRKAAHTYFLGCSDGGRESLMEAQRYPQDFDGYLVGAPGIDFANNAVRGLFEHRTLRSLGPDGQLTLRQLESLQSRVLDRCDTIDGIKDGVLGDPRRCDFDVQEMVCKGAPDSSCLTAAQANAVQSIYDGARDPKTGAQLAPGSFGTMGTEATTWPGLIDPHLAAALVTDEEEMLAQLVYGDPGVPIDLARVAADMKTRINPVINSDSPDLRAARERGRKIIQYHGWADPNVLPQYSLDYFDAVQKLLGSDTRDFYRLFMAPGMSHCKGGVGPSILGGVFQGPTNVAGIADFSGAPGDPEHDIVTALERWVEQGVAPDRIVASEFGVPASAFPVMAPGAPVTSTRLLCPYPQEAVHRGGSTDSAANFDCAMPKREVAPLVRTDFSSR